MKTIGGLMVGTVFGFIVSTFSDPSGLKMSWDLGYKTGKREALSLNPVSEDLEMTCAGLWFGKDGAKYWRTERNK